MVKRCRMATPRVSRETGLPASRSEEPLQHEAVNKNMRLSTPRGARSRAHAQCGGWRAQQTCPAGAAHVVASAYVAVPHVDVSGASRRRPRQSGTGSVEGRDDLSS